MALGKIKADTLEHSTAGSLDTSYVVNGSAKAWAHFDGTATASLDAGLNISSLTDVATGRFQHSFTNNMSDAFSAVGGTGSTDRLISLDTGTLATSSYTIETTNHDATFITSQYVTSAVHGDLA